MNKKDQHKSGHPTCKPEMREYRMRAMATFFATIAIPYVNGKPHIGHALEYFQADAVRRYQQMLGSETLLLSGADENALKNVQAAEKEGIPIQQFLDQNSQVFRDAFEKLGVSLDVFQRGSDQKRHWPGVQKLWELCERNGDIYKKSYEGLYCVGCERFYLEKELNGEGLCPSHLKKPELVKEENYFFKLSSYQERLVKLIEDETLKVIPGNKKAETLSFIKAGLEDFSVSRSKERAKGVGVPVPTDPDQVMYVWFDALSIYITGIGFGANERSDGASLQGEAEDKGGEGEEKYIFTEKDFKKWWPADVHIIGKDINRFHTVYWPAMLLSAGLELPRSVLIHSFINAAGGQKMSKSLGNVIDPFEMSEKYGLEALRYFLLSQIPLAEDGEMSIERFTEVYNADLANGLGNLIARVAKMCENANYIQMGASDRTSFHLIEAQAYKNALSEYKFSEAVAVIWAKISTLDGYINEEKPWALLKAVDPRVKSVLAHCVDQIQEIATLLTPFMPDTARKIEEQFKGPEIKSADSLFPRLV